jgi:hypothetical protein
MDYHGKFSEAALEPVEVPPWASSRTPFGAKSNGLAGRLDFLFGFASERRHSLHLDQERFAYQTIDYD